MSGTLGVSPIREGGVVVVSRLVRSVPGYVGTLRRRGGLTVPVAVPVAIAVTVTVVWMTVTLAGIWIAA